MKTEYIICGAVLTIQIVWFVISYIKIKKARQSLGNELSNKTNNLSTANQQLSGTLEELQKSYVALSKKKEELEILNERLEDRHDEFEHEVIKSKLKSNALLESNALLSRREREIRMQALKLEEQIEVLQDANKLLQKSQIRFEEETRRLNEQKKSLVASNEELEIREKDITQQNKLLDDKIQELGNLNKVLYELNATKNKFFSIMAHDLRNPINGILGNSELLETNFDKLSDDRKKKLNHAIHASSERIASLLESLLQWSMSQSETIQVNKERIDINQLINQVVQLVSSNLLRKNLRIDLQLTDFAEVYADTNMISTVLRNLMGNAIKYSKAESVITFKTSRLEDMVRITIEDHGIGMSEDQLDHLFDTTKQNQRPGTEGEKGTGLGLIICKDFILKNGGELTVKSKLGEGSAFSFVLPVKANHL